MQSELNKICNWPYNNFTIIFNHRRYLYKEDRSYEILNKKWGNDPKNLKLRRGIFGALYIFMSLILCMGSAIYFGSKKY